MNCRTCGYPLWNLPARACPECGAAFAPSQYSFAPGSVRYCCPGCDQAYYGTDASGHLVPREFACVTCGRALVMDELVMRPLGSAESASGPVRGSPIEAIDMPWLERDRLGAIKAWFMTAGRAMTAPRRLMDAIPEATPASHALWFAAMNKAVFAATSTLPGLLLVLVVSPGGPNIFSPVKDLAVFGLGGLLAGLLGLLIWLPLTHFVLRCLGGAHAPSSRTWHALGFASAAGALSAVPVGCVSAAGGIWWCVSAIMMLARAQRCSGGRATGAVLLAGIVAAVPSIAVTAYPIVFGIRAAMLAGAGNATPAGPFSPAGLMDAALLARADAEGTWPDHAIRLLGDSVEPAEFVMDGQVDETDRVAGGPSLRAFAESAEIGPLVDAAAQSLPPDVLAHRVGEWMFCYHGIAASARLGRRPLWIAVSAPPDGARESLRKVGQSFIALNDQGTRFEYALEDWADLVRDQNVARARRGLRPLPTDYAAWCEADVLRER